MHAVDSSVAHVLERRQCVRGGRPPENAQARSMWLQQASHEQELQQEPGLAAAVGGRLHSWLLHGSWALCWRCSSCTPRRLRATDYATPFTQVLGSCASCESPYYVPAPEDVPWPLRNLNRSQLLALRPVVVHQGPCLRPHPQGFRRHAQLTRMSWAVQDVTARMALLSATEREGAEGAFQHLMEHNEPYRNAVTQHRDVLRRRLGGASLPAAFLLKPFLECALFPDLYWDASVADTGWAGAAEQHRSPKKSFLVKCTSPILDYSLDFELLHFQYDRAVLAKFLGRAQAAPQVALRWVLADIPETPLYFHDKSLSLVDLHRQLGPATLMWTIAPGAYSTTWPDAVHHSRAASGARILGGNVLESLHLLHVLDEITRGYIVGGHWQLRGHAFGPLLAARPPSIAKTRAWAVRAEFQEGDRLHGPNAATQGYHGTGVPHIHGVAWVENPEATCLAAWLTASEGSTELEQRAVARQQRASASALPVAEEATHWVLQGDTWSLRVQHPRAAAAAGTRCYSLPLVLAYLGHQDIQMISQSSHVLLYMAKLSHYITKHSQALDDHWLDGLTSGSLAAHMLLRHTHPSEAQMIQFLQHGGSFVFGCHTKRLCLSPPEEAADDAVLQEYLQCSLRTERQSYLEWFR